MGDVLFDVNAGPAKLAFLEDGDVASGRCGFFWLGGFMSDMEGSKAQALAILARETGRPLLRFDYSGHGKSAGKITDGTISGWLAESQYMFTKRAQGRRIIVGSSMGGWLAMLLLRKLMAEHNAAAARICGLVLIAPAADMTADLMWDTFPPAARRALTEDGVFLRPSQYGEPYPITRQLIDDGRRHLLLHKPFDCPCPTRILQGDRDEDVPASHAVRVFETMQGPDIALTLIKGGDHRLSQPGPLRLIGDTVRRFAEQADEVNPARSGADFRDLRGNWENAT
jgi:pimeloyl-ACP methyl ester carboxylesterase